MAHKDLKSWKIAVQLVLKIYRLTDSFPKSETYGLTSQIRRSAISIPSNIAEGAGRNHTKEFIQFLYISLGSLAELETQLYIATELEYIEDSVLPDLEDNIKSIRLLILGLVRSIKEQQ